jgi:hypothetical protein
MVLLGTGERGVVIAAYQVLVPVTPCSARAFARSRSEFASIFLRRWSNDFFCLPAKRHAFSFPFHLRSSSSVSFYLLPITLSLIFPPLSRSPSFPSSYSFFLFYFCVNCSLKKQIDRPRDRQALVLFPRLSSTAEYIFPSGRSSSSFYNLPSATAPTAFYRNNRQPMLRL